MVPWNKQLIHTLYKNIQQMLLRFYWKMNIPVNIIINKIILNLRLYFGNCKICKKV